MGLLSPELSSPGCLGGQGEGSWAKCFSSREPYCVPWKKAPQLELRVRKHESRGLACCPGGSSEASLQVGVCWVMGPPMRFVAKLLGMKGGCCLCSKAAGGRSKSLLFSP